MFVHVNTAAQTCRLVEPEDCSRFHVEADTSEVSAIGTTLGAAGTPQGAPADHVWINVAWVRSAASSAVDGGWSAQFDAMLSYAQTKGWLNDDGSAIQAHIETP